MTDLFSRIFSITVAESNYVFSLPVMNQVGRVEYKRATLCFINEKVAAVSLALVRY